MKADIQNPKRILFISDRFQRVFIITFCVVVMIWLLLSGTIIYLISRSTVTTSFDNSRLLIRSTADFILPSILLSIVIIIMLMSIITILITVLISSHKRVNSLYGVKTDHE